MGDFLKNKKKVILGFSQVSALKNKFERLDTLNDLNQTLLNQNYKEVESSLNQLENSKFFKINFPNIFPPETTLIFHHRTLKYILTLLGTPLNAEKDIILDVHEGHFGFVADYGALTPRQQTRLDSVRETFHIPTERPTQAKTLIIPGANIVEQKGSQCSKQWARNLIWAQGAHISWQVP